MVTQIMANTTDRGFPSPSSRELVYQHTLVLTNPIQPLWRFRDSQRIGEICNQREQTPDVQTTATKGFIPVRSKEHGIAFSPPWLHCIDSDRLCYWERFSRGWFTLQPHKFHGVLTEPDAEWPCWNNNNKKTFAELNCRDWSCVCLGTNTAAGTMNGFSTNGNSVKSLLLNSSINCPEWQSGNKAKF